MKFILQFVHILMLITANISAKIWTVSTEGEYKFCSQINNLVSDGDTIEIEDGKRDIPIEQRNDGESS